MGPKPIPSGNISMYGKPCCEWVEGLATCPQISKRALKFFANEPLFRSSAWGFDNIPVRNFARGLPLTSWYRLQGVGHLLVLLPQDIAQRVFKDHRNKGKCWLNSMLFFAHNSLSYGTIKVISLSLPIGLILSRTGSLSNIRWRRHFVFCPYVNFRFFRD